MFLNTIFTARDWKKSNLNELHYTEADLMILAENLFFGTEAYLKSNTPHELYLVTTEPRKADLTIHSENEASSINVNLKVHSRKDYKPFLVF